jgi:hypothetical protein
MPAFKMAYHHIACFCPKHWLLCHLGLYKFEFEFEISLCLASENPVLDFIHKGT